MILGCRVVRGPDWKWGDQDGGEGGVGTIVDLQNFEGGQKLPSKTVLVCWDNGKQANYRTGLNDCYDLRVFDSSSAGVVFITFTCDGCMTSGITGIRWHCTVCHDFDLCNVCYMNDVHDKNHAFMRFHISNDRTNGTNVGKRSDAAEKKICATGIFPGALVKQGRDWTLDNELGSKVGKVVGLTAWENTPRSAILVNWDNSFEVKHRVGYEGKMDLCLVKAVNGPCYYKDHLPVVSTINIPRPAYTGGNELRKGDMVKTELDVETLKQLAEGHGGWVDGMQKVIGKVGKVGHIDEDGDVHVKYVLSNWVFHPEALCKVTINLRTGDKVRVASNKETVMNLQEGHGGWNGAMENVLGKAGKVIRVVDNGDMVVSIDGRVWVFNPDALILESKEEERTPAGHEDPSASSTTNLELLLNAMLEGVSNASSSETGFEPLLVATTAGNLEQVKQIIGNNKALVNQKFASNKTPLQVACHQGKSEIVSYLLENGADKELRDEQGYTALHHAAYGDETGVCVVVMLSAYAKVNPTDLDRTKVTPLHLAVQRGNETGVVALVQSKYCDVNCQDVLGDTPLHEAILSSQNNIFSHLLKVKNLDPTICNANGFNILHLACLKNCQHAAKLLIEKFPDLVDITKEDGFSALHVVSINNHHEIAKHLILSGHCSINMRNHKGMTALALSVSSSHKEIIELLIEYGADVNVEDEDGDTPLHVAVMKHCIVHLGVDFQSLGLDAPAGNEAEKAIAIFLVTRGGAKTDYSNHQGKTPLDLCIDEELKGMLSRHDLLRKNKYQGETQAALATPAHSVPGSCRAPSPRTAVPLPTVSPVAGNPNLLPTSPGYPREPFEDPPNSFPEPKPIPAKSATGSSDDAKMLSAAKLLPIDPPSPVSKLPAVVSAGGTVSTRPIDTRAMATAPGPATPSRSTAEATPEPKPIPAKSATRSSDDAKMLSTAKPLPIDPPSPVSKLPTVVSAGGTVSTRPIDTRAMATAPGPATPSRSTAEATPAGDISMALANLEVKYDTAASNVVGTSSAESERNTNNVISSEITTSSNERAKMVESQKSNVQDELCRYCGEDKADVIFKPCNHKVVCQGCSLRAKVCLQCKQNITSKIAPGTEAPDLSLTHIKKDYENKIKELERLAICQICMEDDRPSNVVFRPCGHRCCDECVRKLTRCHSCNEEIDGTIVSYQ